LPAYGINMPGYGKLLGPVEGKEHYKVENRPCPLRISKKNLS
jgi:hypothetical protein